MKFLVLATLPLAMTASAVRADFVPAMQAYLDGSIRSWAADPVLVAAIEAANAERADYDQAMIDQLDSAWRSEVGQASMPTITPILQNAASEFLRTQVAASEGRITEVFITDAHGLNVAASDVTSDMWQGDEDKFTKTFPMGPNGVFFGEVELDESTQTYSGQISISIVDPASNEAIGAMTVGVDAETLM